MSCFESWMMWLPILDSNSRREVEHQGLTDPVKSHYRKAFTGPRGEIATGYAVNQELPSSCPATLSNNMPRSATGNSYIQLLYAAAN